MKTLKGKTYKGLSANDSRFYLDYLKKIADQYNNNYCSIDKKPVGANRFDLTEEVESCYKDS